MIKISVILPVFNAEKQLKECIESLLNQSLTELEFIFINDGSSDRSQSIIEFYQKNDSRIVLHNQPNQGVSAARNSGIKIASGNYIGFVDADDTVESDFFEQLYNRAIQNNIDIVVSDYKQEQSGHVIQMKADFPKEKILSSNYIKEILIPTFIKNSSLNTCWNKIYNKKLIDHHHIQFPVGIALGEDGIFNIKAFDSSSSVYFTNYSGYLYKEVEGSATRDLTKKDYFKRALEVYDYDYQAILSTTYNQVKIDEWRSVRLVENVLSYLNIYLEPNKTVPFKTRKSYVKKMIFHPLVNRSIRKYENSLVENKSKYQRFLITCMKYKLFVPLYAAIQYSYYKNKNQ